MYKEPPNKRFFVVKPNSNPVGKSYVLAVCFLLRINLYF